MSRQDVAEMSLIMKGSPNNLPGHLSSFIGRIHEIAQIQPLLAQHRLLTLTGPGGCGKSRLAIQVATNLAVAETFQDGVWLVELAPLADPARVPQAVATVLTLHEQAGGLLNEQLPNYLQSKSMLLLLDNCEHLLAACATLVDTLLQRCPQLHILATSREALGITGERIWLIPSLSCPPPLYTLEETDQESNLISILTQYDALQLFIDRATAINAAFIPNKRAIGAIVRICQQLDGIPLAIELAASRMKMLSVEQIAARLDECFHLLTGGSRTALPRQHTLRATLDWSHDLLTPDEQRLFRRLSVFAGGFSLEAVETICAGEGLESAVILDTLAHLANKSLLTVLHRAEQNRYRLLEMVRQYSREKLRAAREATLFRQRHATFFIRLAKMAEPRLKNQDRDEWLKQLTTEQDNFRAVLTWSLENKVENLEKGVDLIGTLLRSARRTGSSLTSLSNSGRITPRRAWGSACSGNNGFYQAVAT